MKEPGKADRRQNGYLREMEYSLQGPRPKLIQKRFEIVEGRKVPVLIFESLDRMREREEK